MRGQIPNTGGETCQPYTSTVPDLLFEAFVMLIALALVYCFAQNSPLIGLLILGLILARFCLLYSRGDTAVFLLGLFFGGGNDLVSMWQGVYYYTPSSALPLPIPVWMLFFWGEIFVAFRRLIRLPLFNDLKPLASFSSDLALWLDLLWLVPLRLSVYRYASVPWLPEAIFGAALLVRYLIKPPTFAERKLMLAILLVGPAYEIALIHAELYVYQHGVVFGMPLWLVIYWAFIFRLLSAIINRFELHDWY